MACCTCVLETLGLVWQCSIRQVSTSPRSLTGCPCRPSVKALSPSSCTRHAQPIHRRAMHRDCAVNPRALRCYPLLNLPDDLALGGLTLLECYGGLHAS